MSSKENITVGSHVWVEQQDVCWIDGQVTAINGDSVEVQISEEKKVTSKLSKIYPMDVEAQEGGVDDMTKMSYLHEPGVLQNLANRYTLNKIYTYTGNILIAVNPFQTLPYLYDSEMMADYKGAPFGERSPHIFAIADIAYRAMVTEGQSNSILVSGESGAGKTETTKMLMRYLAYLGGRSATEGRTVEQQVLESNPVLEAFGNAKTVRNNNSSRFGKFVEIQFDKQGKISGAAVRTYLLERSRVCQVSDPERNYHCFYLLCAAPKEIIEKFKLGHPRSFHYLNQSHCYELVGVSDAKDYLATRRAMDIVGISKQEQHAIFKVVAAILHLGNIDFEKGSEDPDSSGLKDEKSKFHLETAAELLMCDPSDLESALCKRVMITPEEVIKRSLDPVGATVSRDGLAKTIYSRLFDWLVTKINLSIGQDPNSKCLIGVLDIYGFESFKTNSFEQFCINYTNEKLQQHFNQHVFKMEQEDYKKDEIQWSYIDFVDNQDILDLIEKKPGGIIALLDEACMFPKSTHETFANKLYQTFQRHKRFVKPKLSQTDFTISHYAGDVLYQSDQFLDKNKDYVVAEHQDLLSASGCSFVAGLFPPIPEETSKSSKFSSIGSRFKLQLQQLMETLSSTEPHYIRCVKPNNLLKPAVFENPNVMQQLRCGGVLEAIRISCAGYPTRRTFTEFIERFKILFPEIVKGSKDEREACIKILKKMNLEGYQIGKTKLFLRAGQMVGLNAQREEILGKACKTIQKYMRTYITRKKYVDLRKATIRLQSICRGRLTYKTYVRMRMEASSIKIQRNMRRHLKRKAYCSLQLSALDLQTCARAASARHQLTHKKKTIASTKIQAHWRGHREYYNYYNSKRAVLISQSRWRGRLGRKELKKLKVAAKESGALKEAKDKLEKKVEELTHRLQFENHRRHELVEEKEQEISLLQQSLKEMEMKLEESYSLLAIERENARRLIEEASPSGAIVADSQIPSDAENESLRDEIQTEREHSDELEDKCSVVGESMIDQQNGLIEEIEEESGISVKEATILAAYTEKIELLEAETDDLKALLESEREQAEAWKKRCLRAEKLSSEMQNKLLEIEEEVVQESPILAIETEKIESVIAEVYKLKALLQSERKLAGELQNKCLRDGDTSKVTEEDEASVATKENIEQNESLTSEMYNLKGLLQSEKGRADALEKKCLQAEELSFEKQNQSIEEETSACPEKMWSLTAEIDKLRALLHSESERADEWEKRYLEAEELSLEKQIRSLEDEFVASVVKEDPSKPVDELLIAEVDELKALLLSEKERADEWRKKCLRAEELSNEIQIEQEEGNIVAKGASVSAVDTDKIESLSTEVYELKALLKSERERAGDLEQKCLHAELSSSKNHKELFQDEQEEAITNNVAQEFKISLNSERECGYERERQKKSSEEVEEMKEEVAVRDAFVQLVYTDKLESLMFEIDDLKNLLHSEKEQTEEWRKKFVRGRESSNEMQEQLEEAEERIQELEECSSRNLLHREKERADEWQKKFIRARESSNEMQEQLEEAEERIQELEECSSRNLLHGEKERADEWHKKFIRARESSNEKQAQLEEAEERIQELEECSS